MKDKLACAPGFNSRLRIAMTAHGITTGDQLAKVTGISRSKAYRLLKLNFATHVDAPTILRICEVLGYSGRWMIRGRAEDMVRIHVTPDEQWLLEQFRKMSDDSREKLVEKAKALL